MAMALLNHGALSAPSTPRSMRLILTLVTRPLLLNDGCAGSAVPAAGPRLSPQAGIRVAVTAKAHMMTARIGRSGGSGMHWFYLRTRRSVPEPDISALRERRRIGWSGRVLRYRPKKAYGA